MARYVFCFEMCIPEGRGGEKGGMANFKRKHTEPLTSEIPRPQSSPGCLLCDLGHCSFACIFWSACLAVVLTEQEIDFVFQIDLWDPYFVDVHYIKCGQRNDGAPKIKWKFCRHHKRMGL